MKRHLNSAIAVLCVFAVVFTAFFTVKQVYPLKFQDIVKKYASENSLSEALVLAVIKTESGFDKDKVSKKGASGLMQLMPSTAKFVAEYFYGEEIGDIFSAEVNIRYGTRYLRYLKEKFKSEDTALAAYNAGEGTTSKWLADKSYSSDGVNLIKIPYKETENYLKKVRRAEKFYNIFYMHSF